MILLLVPFLRKLTCSTQSRRFAEKKNPAAKARIWPQIGVLQLAQKPFSRMRRAQIRKKLLLLFVDDFDFSVLNIWFCLRC